MGVGIVLFDAGLQHVLLIERGAPPAEGLWSFPGGLVDGGETLRQACLRELREETGLEAELSELSLVVERLIEDEQGRTEYHFVILDFWGRVQGSSKPRARSDARQARWVAVDEVRKLATTRGVPEAVERALALARGRAPATPLFGE